MAETNASGSFAYSDSGDEEHYRRSDHAGGFHFFHGFDVPERVTTTMPPSASVTAPRPTAGFEEDESWGARMEDYGVPAHFSDFAPMQHATEAYSDHGSQSPPFEDPEPFYDSQHSMHYHNESHHPMRPEYGHHDVGPITFHPPFSHIPIPTFQTYGPHPVLASNRTAHRHRHPHDHHRHHESFSHSHLHQQFDAHPSQDYVHGQPPTFPIAPSFNPTPPAMSSFANEPPLAPSGGYPGTYADTYPPPPPPPMRYQSRRRAGVAGFGVLQGEELGSGSNCMPSSMMHGAIPPQAGPLHDELDFNGAGEFGRSTVQPPFGLPYSHQTSAGVNHPCHPYADRMREHPPPGQPPQPPMNDGAPPPAAGNGRRDGAGAAPPRARARAPFAHAFSTTDRIYLGVRLYVVMLFRSISDPFDALKEGIAVVVAWVVCLWAVLVGIGGVLLGNFTSFITFKSVPRLILSELATSKPVKISVVIATLNDSSSIVRTLIRLRQASTLDASQAQVEVIVVDGGSVDGTVACPDGFDDMMMETLTFGVKGSPPCFVAGSFLLDSESEDATLYPLMCTFNAASRLLDRPLHHAQGVFSRLETYRAAGGFPEQPLFEMYEFVRRVHRLGRIRVLPDAVKVALEGGRCLGVGEGYADILNLAGGLPSALLSPIQTSAAITDFSVANHGDASTNAGSVGRPLALPPGHYSATSVASPFSPFDDTWSEDGCGLRANHRKKRTSSMSTGTHISSSSAHAAAAAWSVGMRFGGLGGPSSRAVLAMSFYFFMYAYLGMSAESIYGLAYGAAKHGATGLPGPGKLSLGSGDAGEKPNNQETEGGQVNVLDAKEGLGCQVEVGHDSDYGVVPRLLALKADHGPAPQPLPHLPQEVGRGFRPYRPQRGKGPDEEDRLGWEEEGVEERLSKDVTRSSRRMESSCSSCSVSSLSTTSELDDASSRGGITFRSRSDTSRLSTLGGVGDGSFKPFGAVALAAEGQPLAVSYAGSGEAAMNQGRLLGASRPFFSAHSLSSVAQSSGVAESGSESGFEAPPPLHYYPHPHSQQHQHGSGARCGLSRLSSQSELGITMPMMDDGFGYSGGLYQGGAGTHLRAGSTAVTASPPPQSLPISPPSVSSPSASGKGGVRRSSANASDCDLASRQSRMAQAAVQLAHQALPSQHPSLHHMEVPLDIVDLQGKGAISLTAGSGTTCRRRSPNSGLGSSIGSRSSSSLDAART
ncbi:hypothetical protein HDU96_000395 [Phlyctochytrium bullatum]|nr:hypothetical protein HDU96_000395 [Phlyctochytrium bullatum]